MRTLAWSVVCSAGVMGITQAAAAHEFICQKTVNGGATYAVTSYPATLHYEFTVTNSHPTDTSIYTSAADAYLTGFSFQPPAPYAVPVGQSVMNTFDVTLNSAEECKALADSDGAVDSAFNNVFTVTWDGGGQASCSAQVTCEEQPPPPEEGGATRTPGFYKTHIDALSECIAEPVDLGFITISTIEEALGLLWAVPAKYESGDKRSELDKARFILARHTLVATCNVRLFGTSPTPTDLIDDAIAALAGTDCGLMHDLAEDVDAFNNSGDDEGFPAGFEAGPATPQQAKEMGDDPTSPSGGVCTT